MGVRRGLGRWGRTLQRRFVRARRVPMLLQLAAASGACSPGPGTWRHLAVGSHNRWWLGNGMEKVGMHVFDLHARV